MMMRMRREIAIGEVDVPAIEELAAVRYRNKHRGITVLSDTDGRGSPRSSSRHCILHRASKSRALAKPVARHYSCDRPSVLW
jgi:hypothetical protein